MSRIKFGRIEVWRFFTYSFMHASLSHLLKNLLGLVLVGIPLEMSHPSWSVATVYGLGVVAGCLGSASFSEDAIPLTGSSGVNFTNVLSAAFMLVNPESRKKYRLVISIFLLFWDRQAKKLYIAR
jgi:membrane associated rhomboid family serine protease